MVEGEGLVCVINVLIYVTVRSSGTPAAQLAFIIILWVQLWENFQYVFIVCTCSLLCIWSDVHGVTWSLGRFHCTAGKLGRELKFDGLLICLTVLFNKEFRNYKQLWRLIIIEFFNCQRSKEQVIVPGAYMYVLASIRHVGGCYWVVNS